MIRHVLIWAVKISPLRGRVRAGPEPSLMPVALSLGPLSGSLHKGTRLCENPSGRPPCLLEVEGGMAHITGTDRAQVLLLPDTVDDSVDPDNPVRFIDAFVDSLDLAGAGFERAEPKEAGRPGGRHLP